MSSGSTGATPIQDDGIHGLPTPETSGRQPNFNCSLGCLRFPSDARTMVTIMAPIIVTNIRQLVTADLRCGIHKLERCGTKGAFAAAARRTAFRECQNSRY
jgi:hypothetical protein